MYTSREIATSERTCASRANTANTLQINAAANVNDRDACYRWECECVRQHNCRLLLFMEQWKIIKTDSLDWMSATVLRRCACLQTCPRLGVSVRERAPTVSLYVCVYCISDHELHWMSLVSRSELNTPIHTYSQPHIDQTFTHNKRWNIFSWFFCTLTLSLSLPLCLCLCLSFHIVYKCIGFPIGIFIYNRQRNELSTKMYLMFYM